MKQQVNSNLDSTEHEMAVISTKTINGKNTKKLEILINFNIISNK